MYRPTRLENTDLLNILCLHAEHPVAVYTGEEIRIELANPAMLAAWGKSGSVVGLTLSEALPEISNQPFVGMLQEVWNTGVDNIGKAIAAELIVDGKLQLYYFDYSYIAVKDAQGTVYAIYHTAKDVTQEVLDQKELQVAREREELLEREQAMNEELAAANEELHATNEELYITQESLNALNQELETRVAMRTEALSHSESRLRYLLSDAPVAIAVFQGRELIIESANKEVLKAWGKSEDIIGLPLHIAVPELIGQEFLQILDNVYASGEAYYGNEMKALLEQQGKIEEVYFNFVYKSLRDDSEKVNGIMITASIVTEQVLSRNKIQLLNEELLAINEELNKSQELLLASNLDLKASENRLTDILSNLHAPVVVLTGSEHIVSTVNQALLKFWNRTKEEVLNRPMLEVFPELKNQVFPSLWKEVLEKGSMLQKREQKVIFKNKVTGEDRVVYVDYFYQPMTDLSGSIIAVLATVLDVTEKVRSRKIVEEAEAKLRLAIESSELGTWFIDAESNVLTASERLKEIFGFYSDEEMPLEAALEQITPEFRETVTRELHEALTTGGNIDMEYSIKGYRDGDIRWVRSTGKLYHGDIFTKANFSGTVQDITRKKLEEQRKDDFLSIASHELKTPITTLKGSLQLLNRYRDNMQHPMVIKLIDHANTSVTKITGLIDDLLNTTRTKEGQLHLNYKSFNLYEMLETCCSHIRMREKYRLILQGSKDIFIEADEARIEQVVVNFVNNAVKYAPDQREIHISVEKTEGKVQVSVKDFGPGIPADKIPYIFDRYYRADYSGVQYSGLGLGLYISAEIIKKHRGEIGVNSELGAGSTFWFTLPVQKV
ncbi:PAS domain S-box protein [Chryseobacterium camelliae]|uniref:PAS domain S-box protein n=1 Tax=Chryseobacterium camelliae TaxID=1265445 RepID=UPI002854F5A7|nr:PAS domain S-box protein [Chryseobacterium camelliae]MDR6514801.1 PAS domain S-box-containing protein [Chryseobacterium camelliae]